MTPIQHHAMCLAVGGYWQLADALELVALNHEDEEVIAIAHPDGERTVIGCIDQNDLTVEVDCFACEGAGLVSCCECGQERECDACDGTGTHEGKKVDPPTSELSWRTLDGEASATPRVVRPMYLSDAEYLVATYQRLIDRLQGKAVAA